MQWRAWFFLLLISFQVLALRDPFYRSNEYQIPVIEKTLSAGVIGDGQCWQVWHKTAKQGWQRAYLKMCPKWKVEQRFNAYLLQWWNRQVFLSQDVGVSLYQGDALLPLLLNCQGDVEQCAPQQAMNVVDWAKIDRTAVKGCY